MIAGMPKHVWFTLEHSAPYMYVAPPRSRPLPTPADDLCAAAGNGDLPLVLACLEDGTMPSALGGFVSFPVLKYAAVNGHLEVMDALLRHGADIDAAGESGLTPLHFTAVTFHLESMRFLLDRGASVSVEDVHGKTPLMGALSMFVPSCMMDARKLAVIECLLDAGAVVYRHGPNHLSALVKVVVALDVCIPAPLQLRTFDMLIAHGADFNERDSTMKTALHHAGGANNLEMVVRLLRLGVDITAVDQSGRTALDDARGSDAARQRAKTRAAWAVHDGHSWHSARDDTRATELLEGVLRRVREKPKMLAFLMGLRTKDTRCYVPMLSTELVVREIFGATKPETAYEYEVEALAELQLRLHAGV